MNHYDLLNDARMGSYYVDKSVKVNKLKGDEYSYQPKVMFAAKPAEMQYLVQNNAALDKY